MARHALPSFCAFLAAVLPAPAGAQTVKLNDPLVDDPLGSVASFRVSGTRVVFMADLGSGQELHSAPADGSAAPTELGTSLLNGSLRQYAVTGDGSSIVVLNRAPDTTQRLYRLPVTGGTPLLLSGPGDVDGFRVDPAGERVVYRSRDTLELFSVPIDASSAPVRLNGTAVTGVVEGDYAIGPDGAWVVYRAAHDAAGVTDLYGAPVDGSAPARRLDLSRPLADVTGFRIAFDGLGVVYRSDQDADEVFELYAVEIDGSSAPVKRSGPLVSGGDVLGFALAAGSDRLVYLATANSATQVELFGVSAIHGGTPVRLNPALAAFANVADVRVSADGSRAVYGADQEADGVFGLYGVPGDGSAPAVRLSDAGQSVDLGETRVRIVEGTGRVLYASADPEELFSAPLDGGQPAVRLHPAHRSGVSVQIHDVMSDGSVLFTADPEFVGLFELFRVPIDGSAAPLELTPGLATGSRVSEIAADVVGTPGGGRVVFLVRHYVVNELFSVPAQGGASTRLSGELARGQVYDGVREFQITPRGDFAVFLAAEDPAFLPDLHSAATDGGGRSTQLNRSFGRGGMIERFAVSPDGEWVVYRLRNFDDELHSAPIRARKGDLRIDRDPPASDRSVGEFVITPDSAQVVYAASGTGGSSISVVPIDCRLAPVEIAKAPSDVTLLKLSPDGAWVVYQSQSASALSGLSAVPLDGHLPPVLLDPQSSWTTEVEIAPDSSRVVYRARDSSQLWKLYSAPIDGSLPPLDLDAGVTGQVWSYRISLDGARVVFWATGLHSVPVDGSQLPVMLNGTPSSAYSYEFFQIDPTSTRVVYAAAEGSVIVTELYSVPIDGSLPRIKLSESLGPAESVAPYSFRIGAGGRVVYGVQSTIGTGRLMSVPIDGSAPPLQLRSSFVSHPTLTADGERVIYAGMTALLFVVPIDGSAPPRPIHGPDVRILSLLVSPDRQHVLLGADQGNGIVELYSAWLDRLGRRADAPVFR